MGVHGLTTYLRENTRSLSNNVQFPLPSGDVVPVVIDGWSFIYNLYYDSKLPWVYGGEYPEFSKLVVQVVEAWIQLGLKIYFVFDGACPDLKFPARISRLGQTHVQPGLLFFRTSAASRATPRFLHESRILPPLTYATCVHTLEELAQKIEALEVHYADEEGDPYSVELAGRVGGYVASNDSDFAILNAPGYLGYIPLDDMVWESAVPERSLLADDNDDGDFQKVRKHKGKKKGNTNTGNGAIPPEGAQELRLTCGVYHPNILASHLNLPVTLLPLLSALVGNDFTAHSESDRRSIQSLFFERRLTIEQRIESAAAAMRNVLSPAGPRKKGNHQVGSVMDLIDRTVNLLLSRLVTPLSSGEVDGIIDKVVSATLQYAIPKYEGDASLLTTDICALHSPDLCPFLRLISRRVLEESEGVDGETPALLQSAAVRTRYVQAYRRGALSPKLMDALNTGTSWPRLFLENPDLETVSRSITRPLRVWIYSILDDLLGLPIAEEDDEETDAAAGNLSQEGGDAVGESDDENELIDVAESDSEEEKIDFLAPLKGALQRLHLEDGITETDASMSVVSQRSSRVGKPRVTEYVRRGTRITAEVLPATPLDKLLSSISCNITDTHPDADETISLVQRSPEERFTIFLRILQSDLPSVHRLPSEQLQPVLAIRWIARCLHERSIETGSRDREKEKWTSHEVRCSLAAFASWPNSHPAGAVAPKELPPVRDRNVQICAQLLATLETIEDLSQALLLTPLVPSVSNRFSGKLLHSYFSGTLALPEGKAVTEMWEACRESLAEGYREAPTKEKKAPPSRNAAVTAGAKEKKAGLQGAFSLLVGLGE